MQLFALLPVLTAVANTVYGQNFQQGSWQFVQAQQRPQQQYWQDGQQSQFYPPQQRQQARQPQQPQQPQQLHQPQQLQQAQQFFLQQPAQVNYQPNSVMFISAPQQQRRQVVQQFPNQQPQPMQFQPFRQQFQPQIQFNQPQPQQRHIPRAPPPSFSPQRPRIRQKSFRRPNLVNNQRTGNDIKQFKSTNPIPNKPNVVRPEIVKSRHLEVQQRIRIPSPPGRFLPHLADIYGKTLPDRPYTPSMFVFNSTSITFKPLPDGLHGGDQKNVTRVHVSYIEDTAKTSPAKKSELVLKPQSIESKKEAQMRMHENFVSMTRRPPKKPNSQTKIPTTTRQPSAPKSSLVKIVPKSVMSTIASKNPNTVYLSCCKSVKVAKACERICNFDILNKKTLTGMFLGTDPCPQSFGLDLLQCAAQSEDHTNCCRAREVQRTAAGDKCLRFCNMRPGVNFQADVSMLPCWAVLYDIKSCFQDHIKNS